MTLRELNTIIFWYSEAMKTLDHFFKSKDRSLEALITTTL